MLKVGLINLFLLLIFMSGHSQSEIKIYGGYIDYPGISLEHKIADDFHIEIGTSFRSKKDSYIWIGSPVTRRVSNLFINCFLKKYRTNLKGKFNFFYGGYIRYWQDYSFRLNHNILTQEQKEFVNSRNDIIHSSRKNKISFGGLIGYKIPVGNRISFSLTLGVGSALAPTYWEKKKIFNVPDSKVLITEDYTGRLSTVGQISIGYKFRSKTENK